MQVGDLSDVEAALTQSLSNKEHELNQLQKSKTMVDTRLKQFEVAAIRYRTERVPTLTSLPFLHFIVQNQNADKISQNDNSIEQLRAELALNNALVNTLRYEVTCAHAHIIHLCRNDNTSFSQLYKSCKGEFRAFVVNTAVPLQVLHNEQSKAAVDKKKQQYESVLRIITEREQRTLPHVAADDAFSTFEVS